MSLVGGGGMKFAYSGLAVRFNITTHGVGIIEATSQDEAAGKAMRIQHKLYPAEDGWEHHDVVLTSVDSIPVEPETAHIIGS